MTRKILAAVIGLLITEAALADGEVFTAPINTAYDLHFTLLDAAGALDVNETDGGTDVSVACDTGAEGTATNDFTDRGSRYSITLTSGEMNCKIVSVFVAGEITNHFTIQTYGASAAIPALPAVAAGANGGLPLGDASGRVGIQDGTGAGQIDTNAGAVVAVTTTTNLTNAPPNTAADAALLAALIPLGAVQTADSGTTTTLVDAALTQASNDWFRNAGILFVSGGLAGQQACATGFTASSDTVTFAPAVTTAVTTNQYYFVTNPACAALISTLTANTTQLAGQTVSASGTVTFPAATLASTTNITQADARVTHWNGVALATTNPLPNVAAGANGGLPLGDASGRVGIQDGTGAGQIDTNSGAVVSVTTATNVTTVNGLAANVITDAASATDFETRLTTQATSALTSYDPSTDTEMQAYRDAILRAIGRQTTITVTDQDTFTLAAGATFDDAYIGWGVKINDAGTQDEWLGKVEDYVGSSKTVELNRTAGFTIATGDTVTLIPAFLYEAADTGAINCVTNTANFAGSTTTLACILTDKDGAALTFASGDLTGKEILITSGAQLLESRYVFSTTWDGANSELQITLDRALPATLADAVTAIIR